MSQTANTRCEQSMPTEAPQPAVASTAQPRGSLTIRQWLGRTIPNVLVIAALAGLGVWGYATDWRIPKFSTLVGNVPTENTLWCDQHNVPELECIECNSTLALAEADYGWCKEHGVTNCPLEHPDVAQLATVPPVQAEDLDRARRALELLPRADNNSRCTLHQHRIQFASIDAVEKAGVDIAVVAQRPILEAITANGEVTYDETRMARLSSRVAGTVLQVEKQVGDHVLKGDVLALIDSAAVGQAKSEFLTAITLLRLKQSNAERLRPLASDGVVAGRRLLEAEAAYEEARIEVLRAQQNLLNLGFDIRVKDFEDVGTEEIARKIRLLGLPSDLIARFGVQSTTSNLFPLRSSIDGIVTDRNIVEGEVVDTAKELFSVANIDRLWLTLNVRQDDAKYLSIGQTVLFRTGVSHADPEINGTINWISTAADDVTRTLRVRAELPNPSGKLRANTFGMGRIVLREEPEAIVVPSEAVHWDGTCHVVFVRDKDFLKKDSPKFFHVRSVRPGVTVGDNTEIIAGLLPGEVIASKNSMVLEAQLLKSNLGAGCGCCTVPTKSKD